MKEKKNAASERDRPAAESTDEVLTDQPGEAAEAVEAEAAAKNEAGDSAGGADNADACTGAEETASLETALKEAEDKFLRLQAEFQNYKKRIEKEKQDFMKYASETFLRDLLPLMDNMERAETVMASSADEKIREGVELVKRSLGDLFTKYEVVKIPALGAAFDPELHHAVLTEEADGQPADHVLLVLQEGYTYKGKVIRPSMVKVSK